MKANKPAQPDDWRTPAYIYDELNARFDFDFDPCPFQHDMSWDGLEIEWGQRNFVNPPYSRPHLANFVKKAIRESAKGKLCVLLIPASTDTALFHDWILPYATQIDFVRGRIKFEGYNNRGEFCNMPAMKGSMIVVFDNIDHE
jgi:phage N-6-adenine-methyltransferase